MERIGRSYVDAKDGSIVEAFNAVTDAATTGSGYGVLDDYKTLNTYSSNGTYYLYDVTKPMNGVIETFTASNGSSLPGYYTVDSNNLGQLIPRRLKSMLMHTLEKSMTIIKTHITAIALTTTEPLSVQLSIMDQTTIMRSGMVLKWYMVTGMGQRSLPYQVHWMSLPMS